MEYSILCLCVYMCDIQSSLNGFLGWLHFIYCELSCNKHGRIYLSYTDFISFEQILKSGNEWIIWLFSDFWGTSRLSSVIVVLVYAPTNSGLESLFPPHPCKHLLFFDFQMVAILNGLRWSLLVVYSCILLMATDLKHFSCLFFRLNFIL